MASLLSRPPRPRPHPPHPVPSVCRDRKWNCTDRVCDATCSALGLAHYLTFDGLKYLFPGECQYVLAQVRAGFGGGCAPRLDATVLWVETALGAGFYGGDFPAPAEAGPRDSSDGCVPPAHLHASQDGAEAHSLTGLGVGQAPIRPSPSTMQGEEGSLSFCRHGLSQGTSGEWSPGWISAPAPFLPPSLGSEQPTQGRLKCPWSSVPAL